MQSQTKEIEPFSIALYCATHVQNALAEGEPTVSATFSEYVLTAILQAFAQAGYGPTGVLETMLLRHPLSERSIAMLEAAIERAGKAVVAQTIREAVQELDGGRGK